MRALMGLVVLGSLAGCKKDDLCAEGDTGCYDTGDTAFVPTDTDTDSDSDTDADTTPTPPPKAYYDPTELTLGTATDVEWPGIRFDWEIGSFQLLGFTTAFTLGVEVEGSTSASLDVGGKLEEQSTRGQWNQYYTPVADGGSINNILRLGFPMEMSLDDDPTDSIPGSTFDIWPLASALALGSLPQLTKMLPEHVFDTLLLDGDGLKTDIRSSGNAYEWNSGWLDPASWAPYIMLDLSVTYDYAGAFTVLQYESAQPGVTSAIGKQTQASERIDVSAGMEEPGEEATTFTFDARAVGELTNAVTVDVAIDITFKALGIEYGPVTISADDLVAGDPAGIKVPFIKQNAKFTKR